MSKDLIVLAPNGRRQTVKCTLNTTILQVLEEVCKKQGFDPSQYDLKHHNTILDLTNTIRFSNLPNKASLEMVETERQREESVVTIGLQLESDERRVGEFSPQSTLYSVVETLARAELASCRHATVVYMRHEVHGDRELRATTLRQLGLTGGRAVLRLLDKSIQQLQTQANVSSVLAPRPVQAEEPTTSISQAPTSHSEPVAGPSGVSKHVPTAQDSNPIKLIKDEMRRKANVNAIDESEEAGTRAGEDDASEDAWNVPLAFKNLSQESGPSASEDNKLDEELLTRRLNIEQEVNFLGENKAIAFVQSSSEPEFAELPDEFYELTVDEVRRLYRDLRHNLSAITEAPLLTSDQRAAEQATNKNGSSHKHVVVRVQFPDGIILQGVFTPTDTIQQVHNFTSQYIKEAHRPFHLYTTPSREALNMKVSLEQAGFVPCVLMHFRWADDGASVAPFLKDHVYNNCTSSDAAALLASKYRATSRRKLEPSNEQNRSPAAGTSSSKDGKVPKWLKLRS